jgi:hypothetical protein
MVPTGNVTSDLRTVPVSALRRGTLSFEKLDNPDPSLVTYEVLVEFNDDVVYDPWQDRHYKAVLLFYAESQSAYQAFAWFRSMGATAAR